MNKRITFELTQEEYDAVCKLWERAKKSPIEPSKALNFDDFCKEAIVMMAKGPNFEDMMKNLDLDSLMSAFGDPSQLKDMLNSFKKDDKPKTEEKKDVVPDDKKYKS